MAKALDHDAGERRADLRVFELILGRGQGPVRASATATLFNSVSNSTSRISSLLVSARSTPFLLLSRLPGCLHGPFRDVNLGSFGPGLGQLRGGQFSVRLGAVASPRHLLGPPEGHGFHLFQIGIPRVFLLGQDQIGRGGLQSGLGLLDPMLDLVLCQLQTSLALASSALAVARVRRAISI